MTKRLIFINCPSPFLVDDKGAPPLGVLWLAAIARNAGHKVMVCDLTGSTEYAKQFGCEPGLFIGRDRFDLPLSCGQDIHPDRDIFGLTCTSAQYETARNLLLAIKLQYGASTQVIIGGSHVSALPDAVLNDGFDSVFTGECDLGLPAWLEEGCQKGIIHCPAPRNLDVLPLPARDLVDLPSYCSNLTVGHGFSTTVMQSRGCSFACKYCVRTLGDAARLLRVRSVKHCLEECHALNEKYGLYRFVAVDDIWGVKRPWVAQFCDYFAGAGYHFRVNCRSNVLHEDLLPHMKRAGVDVISFGFESGDSRVLNAISKNTVDANEQAIEQCHNSSIAVKAYLIFGFAEDDAASVEATQKFIERTRPESCQVSWLIPLPGTPLYQEAIARGWQPDYASLYHLGRDRRGSMMPLPWHTEETANLYDELCDWIESFYEKSQPPVTCPNALSSEVA